MNSPESQTVLIAAASGRALAASARRAGYRPLVADFFDDLDTRALAAANVLAGDTERGFEAASLVERLNLLAAGESPTGVVYGGGFEDRPELLDEIARHFPLYGNSAEIVARAKNPRLLAHLCHDLAIPHPEIGFDPPSDPSQWLVKREGGGGGIHIAWARSKNAGPGEYYQRRVRGTPISVLLLADGSRSVALGTSTQWSAPSRAMPFRFGGAVRPADFDCALARELSSAAAKIASSFQLVGLNSVDFLVGTDGYHLLEINPRPGATLDIFADRDGRLFSAHLEACCGHLPNAPLIFTRAAATAIAYASNDFASMPDIDWPAWCRDRQKPETRPRMGDPICTILAEAEEAEAARALVIERLAAFREHLTDVANKESVA